MNDNINYTLLISVRFVFFQILHNLCIYIFLSSIQCKLDECGWTKGYIIFGHFDI